MTLQEIIKSLDDLSIEDKTSLFHVLESQLSQIKKNHNLEVQAQKEIMEDDTDFSAASFHKSWEEAVTGKTLPLSQLWEDIDVD